MSDELRYERVGAAAVITIDRAHRRNAIDAAAAEAFRQGLAEFEADEGARVLVLTGAGGEAFCAGADLKAMDLDVDHPHGPMGPSRLTPAKPAIAAVDGWCLAGGVEWFGERHLGQSASSSERRQRPSDISAVMPSMNA